MAVLALQWQDMLSPDFPKHHSLPLQDLLFFTELELLLAVRLTAFALVSSVGDSSRLGRALAREDAPPSYTACSRWQSHLSWLVTIVLWGILPRPT